MDTPAEIRRSACVVENHRVSGAEEFHPTGLRPEEVGITVTTLSHGIISSVVISRLIESV